MDALRFARSGQHFALSHRRTPRTWPDNDLFLAETPATPAGYDQGDQDLPAVSSTIGARPEMKKVCP
jgi:hypothetical protein